MMPQQLNVKIKEGLKRDSKGQIKGTLLKVPEGGILMKQSVLFQYYFECRKRTTLVQVYQTYYAQKLFCSVPCPVSYLHCNHHVHHHGQWWFSMDNGHFALSQLSQWFVYNPVLDSQPLPPHMFTYLAVSLVIWKVVQEITTLDICSTHIKMTTWSAMSLVVRLVLRS